MRRLLIVVDMQNDFIDGVIGTPEAVAIVPSVVAKIQEYEKNGETIIFTQDTHFDEYLSTQEGRNLPVVHCIKGTKGWEICDDIQKICDLSKHTIFEKKTFGSSELARNLESPEYNNVTEIELVGLCTDICIISNALMVKAFLPEVSVIVDARCCAGVSVESHKNALEALKMCQIQVVE